jgi:hypothetical protein
MRLDLGGGRRSQNQLNEFAAKFSLKTSGLTAFPSRAE